MKQGRFVVVIYMLVIAVVLTGCIESDTHAEPEVRYIYVKETPTPTPTPTPEPNLFHYIPHDELDDPVYENYDDNVNEHIKEVCSEFAEYMPAYMGGEVDCNDMAVYLWNKLQERGIKTVLVLGSTDGEYTSFGECNHVWLRCLTPNAGYTIEATTPAIIYSNGYRTFRTSDEIEVLVAEDMRERKASLPSGFEYAMDEETYEKRVRESYKSRFIEDTTKTDKYSYGFYYAKPSDLRADLGDRW